MIIGITINRSWNIYNFRKGLIQSLLKDGHEVVAIAPEDGYGKKLEDLGCKFYSLDMDNKGSNPLNDLRLTMQLYNIYKKANLDVVLQYTIKPNIFGSIAAHLCNIPSICNVTGLGTVFIHDNITSKIARFLYKTAFRFPSHVFFQNRDDQMLFISQKLVEKRKTSLLPGSGVDIQHFTPGNRVENKVFTFLLVARILYDKGIVEYVEAARKLKAKGIEVKCQLLGEFDYSSGLGIYKVKVDHWEEEGLIEYLGATNDVRPYLDNADCVVLPSYREGTPRSLLEAASQGKPLVATDVPGCREVVVDTYNGFLCEAKNADDLSEKMERMVLSSPNMIEYMGKNSRKLAESKFDEKIVINRYHEKVAECTNAELVNAEASTSVLTYEMS
ncbi:glycosyltransferase family 4 protein [Chondrinema litorale]|uniref:glycosyltransferase family 4 protein n=1 Tax=Chondrinema litorale TaxID=2994555 RepID=UPI0025438F97|nr:glycosyltransferase family 4 protein [Chondrinema litorale]UZR95850.1 glycosyltransferase family 4 protein [Chondrinema litorale]